MATAHKAALRSENGDWTTRLAALATGASALGPISLRTHQDLAGIAGLDLPRRVGGSERAAAAMAPIFRDCARIDLELRDVPGGGHARLLAHVPTRRFDALLRAVARAEAFCAIAITEPGTGSDLQGLATKAVPDGTGYKLKGLKQHISRIGECTHFIVFASVYRDPANPLVTAFLVPRDAPGLSVEAMSPMGMAQVSWGRVRLDDVMVPADGRVGGEGQGMTLFVRHFSYWRTMMVAAAIGSAQVAVERAIERMQTRDAFGGPIGRFTHLQQELAKHIARLRMAWLLVENVAAQFTNQRWPVFDAAMAKAEGMEAAVAATEWAMSIFGASGYDVETGLEKRYRDLVGLRIADGTTDLLRGQVARAVLGERLYELALNRKSPEEIVDDDTPRRVFW